MESKNYKNSSNSIDNFFDITFLIKIFTRNWKWFALSIFLFSVIGTLYFLIKNPVYEVDALVLLQVDDKKNNVPSVSMVANLSDLGSMMGSKNIDNEVVVFNTRKLLKKSILDLNMNVSMNVRKGLRKVNPYPELPFFIKTDSVQADTMKSLSFKMIPQKDGSYKVKGKYHKTKFKSTINNFPATLKTPGIDVYIEKNPLVVEKKPKTIDVSIQNPNVMAIKLKKIIFSSAYSKKTTIVTISTKTDNIKWSQDLINKIIVSFNEDAIEDKNLIASLTAKFVKERLKLIEEEIKDIEKQVEKYKHDNQLVDLSTEARLYLSQMSGYEARSIEVQTQLNMTGYIKEYIRDEKNKNNLIPTIGIEDKGLVEIISKYNQLLSEKINLENSSTESNPALNLTNAQLSIMRQNILASINNLTQSKQILLKDLQKQDVLAGGKIQNIPRQEREFIEIVRQQGIKSSLYSFLLQKSEETELNLASATPKAKIIDEPMPGLFPKSPKKSIIAFIALTLGLIFPLVCFYLKNLLKTEVESKEELENLSQVDIIGEICKSEADEKIVVKPHETKPSAELFRLLRTNLTFTLTDPSKQVVMITSTVAGEGKTYISINLALSLALIGKKVIVVGLDIRSPRLTDYLEIPNSKGITNFLIDPTMKISDIIQHSKINSHLDIIQAGAIPPNPNELLMNTRLDDLFVELRHQYDFIIVDTAPVGLVSDTFLLDRFSDVNLYVVRIGYAHKDAIKYLNSVKKGGKLKNMYVVANDIDLNNKNGGYGYGYGNNTKKK